MHINGYICCSIHIFLKHVLVHVIKNSPEYIFSFPHYICYFDRTQKEVDINIIIFTVFIKMTRAKGKPGIYFIFRILKLLYSEIT